MKTPQFVTALVVVAACLVVGVGSFAPGAKANPSYLQAFRDQYPYPQTSLSFDIESTTGSACYTCHNRNAFFGDWNCYRRDLISRLRAGRSIQEAFVDIELVDSDSDGVNNITEILTSRGSNGQIGYNPGLVGPLGTDPCLTPSFNGVPGSALTVTGRLETPPPVVTTGACCSGVLCTITTSAACDAPGLRFAGLGFACNAPGNTTTPCCKADFNQDGARTVDDIFIYLLAWFAMESRAALVSNGTAAPTIDDIFLFINVWFAGC